MERMVALMAADDIVRADWNEASEGVLPETSGDVIWSDRKQEGYMRFRGLPSNDPTKTQYQLWIVDPSRDERPVDGGVFDVAPGISANIGWAEAGCRVFTTTEQGWPCGSGPHRRSRRRVVRLARRWSSGADLQPAAIAWSQPMPRW